MTHMDDMQPPVVYLFGWRHAKGFTQVQLADLARVSRQAIAAIEGGQTRKPHANTVTALAKALGITESELRSPPPR